ncbi:PP2C family protein-serine/threonine phosphatase [Gimesia chilikensis]|uniref:Phosphoserine phosphatase RsbU n=1 Tax=Gimesia chilikensis TaxID=2605989 RepID=A0A517WF48_9PLAN|nr:PP2C family protein-serine/threonine phosphatase [Gimesia chilikensis]QDU03886.1 Phosphoserine phosphatase RsbU [Gimesia chilikensis]
MRILVGWDNPQECELISMYLGVSENEVRICATPEEFLQQAAAQDEWDIILMSITSPDPQTAYDNFEQVRQQHLDTPIVGACPGQDTFHLARFLTAGMRAYIIRDDGGDFMFLMEVTLESVVNSVKAERERFVAERLREEVESVRKLQESIIPTNIISPDRFDVTARYESSQIRVFGGQPVTLAGGDYYDVFMLDDENLVLLVGDASGHGMKACMSIMTMHTLVGMIRSNRYLDTAAFVKDVNNRLCEQAIVNDDGGFITLLYGILNSRTNEFQWTSAGAPIPIVHELETNQIYELGTLDDGGLPLGIVPDVDYDVHTSKIPPDSRLLIFTDGLAEAFPGEKEQFGEFGIPGIMQSLQESRSTCLDSALENLFRDSNAFTDGSGRHDDTSVVLLGRKN